MNIGDLVQYTFDGILSIGVVMDISPSGWTVTVLWDDGEIEPVDFEGCTLVSEGHYDVVPKSGITAKGLL